MREKLKNLLILLLGLLMVAQLMVNLALGLGEDTLQTLRMRLGMDTRPDSTQTAFAELGYRRSTAYAAVPLPPLPRYRLLEKRRGL